MAYRHVLAAVDITDEAVQVLEKAKAVAADHRAQLDVLTVVSPLTHVYGGLDVASYGDLTVRLEREAQDEARRRMETFAEGAGVAPGNVHVVIGAPVQQIADWAQQRHIDLIVVGSHGKHGLGLLLGSVANGVVHHASCDVLTVRVV